MTADCAFYLGLDLGPSTEPTALAVLSRPRVHSHDPPARRRPPYAVRHLDRFPPGTPYPDIVATLLALLRQPVLHGCMIGVDRSGVGEAVLRMVQDTLSTGGVTCRYRQIAVTPAAGAKWHVPRHELAATIQILLQTRRVVIPRSLAMADLLVDELTRFRADRPALGGLAEPWRVGANDDLVLAVGIAAWLGERGLPPLIDPPEVPLVAGYTT